MTLAPTFQDRIAVVTGASRGIGAATAVRLGAMGAQCILVGRTLGGLEATDDAIRQAGGAKAVIVPLDLQSDHDRIDALGAELFARYGRLDILVGNAAQLGVLSPVGHIEPKTWDETFALNVTANFRLLRSFDPLLRLSQAGRALFLTCAIAQNPEPFWGVYAASKAALEKMVACYAAEMAETTVKAQCFDPGATGTYLYRKAFPGLGQTQMQTPEQAAEKIIAAVAL
jgi:NAD(P)-dependent dehydrogenase (short-subunit alcohol dehydrogenase family)